MKAAGLIFTDNPIFIHGHYRIQMKQALNADTFHPHSVSGCTELFLGPNTEDGPVSPVAGYPIDVRNL